MVPNQNVDLRDTSFPSYIDIPGAPDWSSTTEVERTPFSGWKFYRTRSTVTKLDGTAEFSSLLEKKRKEERGEFRNYPQVDIEKKQEMDGTLNPIDIQSALTEELVRKDGALLNPYQSIFNQSRYCYDMKEIVHMFRSFVTVLICTILKSLLAYSLVFRSNLSCVQRTYVGLWRPNEHCDY